MNEQKTQFYFLFAVLLATSALVFLIFRPFLYPLIFAIVFTVIFQPVCRKIEVLFRGRRNLAAFVTVFLVLVFILAPLVVLGTQIYQEIKQFYFSFSENHGKEVVFGVINSLLNEIYKFIPSSQNFSINLNQYAGQSLSLLLQNLGSVFSNLAKLIFSSFVFLITFYYLLINGKKIKKYVIALSPLPDVNDEMIFKKLETAVNSIIKGSLLVALIQGALAAIGFYIFGIPNPTLWGSVAAIAAFIPGFGTSLVIFPAVVYLFFMGDFFHALGLMLWGATAVGLIDNFLGPKFIGSGTRIHPILILFSVLGGIGFFGPVGFLLGPLILSLFSALLDIYFLLIKNGGNCR